MKNLKFCFWFFTALVSCDNSSNTNAKREASHQPPLIGNKTSHNSDASQSIPSSNSLVNSHPMPAISKFELDALKNTFRSGGSFLDTDVAVELKIPLEDIDIINSALQETVGNLYTIRATKNNSRNIKLGETIRIEPLSIEEVSTEIDKFSNKLPLDISNESRTTLLNSLTKFHQQYWCSPLEVTAQKSDFIDTHNPTGAEYYVVNINYLNINEIQKFKVADKLNPLKFIKVFDDGGTQPENGN